MGREAGAGGRTPVRPPRGGGKPPQAAGPGVVSVGPGIPENQRHRFAGTPPEHQALVEDFVVQEGLTSELYPGMEVSGQYDPRIMRTIYVNPNMATGKTVPHELGHAVWHEVLTQEQRTVFELQHNSKLGGIRRKPYIWGERNYISGYAGESNHREAFADLYAYATSGSRNSGERFARAAPRQQGIMREVLGHYCKW